MIGYCVLVSIVESYVYITSYSKMFKKKFPYPVLVLFMLITSTILCTLLFLGFHDYVIMLFYLIEGFMFTLMFEGTKQEKALFTFVIIGINLMTELVAGFIIRTLNDSDINIRHPYYFFGLLCSKLLFLVIMRVICGTHRKIYRTIPIHQILILEAVPIVSIATVFGIGMTKGFDHSQYVYIFIALCGITVINVFVFILFDTLAYQSQEITEMRCQKMSLEWDVQKYEAVIKQNEITTAYTHDLVNHFRAIARLVEEESSQELKAYCDKLKIKGHGVLHEKIFPNSPELDAVIMQKIQFATDCGIQIDYDIKIPHILPIDSVDFCVIIGNSLDNAIEACNKLKEDKRIEIKIYCEKGRLIIVIMNTSHKVKIEDGKCRTTKKEPFHGYGLINIEETIKKYNGNMVVTCVDGIFTNRMYLLL